jgi:CrcB protein
VLCQVRGWTRFPWATLAVNAAGCLAIMLIFTVATATAMRDSTRLFLTTGLMGGLTTYSTFDYEATKLMLEGNTAKALLYIGATLAVCFGAGLLGVATARIAID